MNPLIRRTAWHVPRPLDLRAMRAAARLFPGRHDFKSFAANRNYEMASTLRTVTRCDMKRSGRLLTFVIEGDGFLYKMCRGSLGRWCRLDSANSGRRHQANAGEERPSCGGDDRAGARVVLWKVSYKRQKAE